MKIGILTCMSGVGGTENVSARLAKLLLDNNYKVFLLSSEGPLVNNAIEQGVKWFFFDFYSNSFVRNLFLTIKLIKLIRLEELDILHCQMARPVLPAAIAAFFSFRKVKVVWHSRGLEAQTYPKVCRFFNFIKVYAIANCRHERDKLIKYGYSPSRVSYSYNPLPKINIFIPKKSSNKIRIGTLSRLSKDRNVSEALYILKEVLSYGYDAELYIAGIGDELESLQFLAKKLNISDRVFFLGKILNLSKYFSDIDILINTISAIGDNGAGVGNNILEAAFFKTPVVTYDSCGIREIVINGETGYCVPLGNRKIFVESLLLLISDGDLRERFGTSIHEHVNKVCGDHRVLKDTISTYKKALGG